ncbi:MAG: glycosyltransferase [Akkermansiaceae bacterium]|nr:glycosyltransferase [Akkermansiaceae bacterium]NNM30047.1 glycosyltransferase [Akkermansiaceae bacterium]
MPPRLLLVFVKEPLAGQVKTRLARTVGGESAARIYKAMVHVLLRQLGGLQDCRLRFCFAPDDAHDAIRFWLLPGIIDDPRVALDPDLIDFRPQGAGDLGARLSRAFAEAFAEGFGKVAVIGTDCIEVSSRWVHAAFAQLHDRHEAVFGPTPDGGYHLLALRKPHLALFDDIPWSTATTLAATIERSVEMAIPFYRLPPLPDIDTAEDYENSLRSPLGPALRKALDAID